MNAEPASRELADLSERQRRTILGLAAEAHVPVAAVADVYRRELAELKRRARITQFVPVIASRRVRHRLRQQRLARAGSLARAQMPP